ncbi:MAG: CHAP domain-containing protein, partial [Planctomycetes bacterium]|nr:CHAP domain-containing protein [Planctomycetota bacterium]
MPDTSNCMRARGGIYAKFNNHIRNTLHGIVVLGLALSAMGATSRPAAQTLEAETGITPDASTTGRVPDSTNQCLTKVVRITLASEQIHFCTPISQPYNVIEDNISDRNVSYAQLNQVNGYGVVNIKSVTPGYSPGIGRPVYDLGGVDEYRQAVWDIESSKTDRVVSNGPTGVFWNETVPGIQIDVSLPMSLGNMKVRTIEWYLEHNSRLWSFIITWDTEIENSNEWNEISKNISIQKPEGVKFADTAIDLGTAFQVSNAVRGNADSGIPPEDVGPPAWWSGVCDDDNYFEATGVHSFQLSEDALWYGVPACGPRYPSHIVHFFPGAWGEIEFECVELVMRFLYQEWGIAPWAGNANKIKNSPPDSIEFYNNNGTHAFVPGDIITEDGITQNSPGHTVIITGVNLDEYGTGSISILEQNASSNGSRLLAVTKWKIDPDAYTWGQTIQGWLHAKANHGLTVTIYGDAGVGDATLNFEDNGPQTATTASDGTYSLTVPYNWSGTVTPSRTDYTFRPASRTYTNITVGGTNQNYTAAPDTKTTGSVPVPGNTFTGTLTLPSGWLDNTTIRAKFVGTASDAAINAGALSNDNNTWGDWVAASSDVTATTTWDVSGEGANKPVYLRLRDINDQVTTVVTGMVNVDITKPTSTMTALTA